MKIKKMLEQLGALLDKKTKKVVQKKAKIKSLLKQLNQEKHKLIAELEAEQDKDKARQLRRKLKIVKTERHKGIRMLKKAIASHKEANLEEVSSNDT